MGREEGWISAPLRARGDEGGAKTAAPPSGWGAGPTILEWSRAALLVEHRFGSSRRQE